MLHYLLTGLLLAGALGAQDLFDKTKLRTFKLTTSHPAWFTTLDSWHKVGKTTYLKADLEVDGFKYKDVGFRFRGGKSYTMARMASSMKVPFRISMDEFVPGRRIYGRQTVKLNSGYEDPTFLREALAYELLQRYLPASQVNWVKLVINNSNFGVYVNVESVNSDFQDRWFADDSGNRYKGSFSFLAYLGTNPNSYAMPYPLKSSPTTTAYHDLIEVAKAINGRGSGGVVVDTEKLFDIETGLRYQAMDHLLANNDGSYRHNYYLINDPLAGRMTVVPWDQNQTLNFADRIVQSFQMLTSQDIWKRRMNGYLKEMAVSQLNWSRLGPMLTTWHKHIDAEVKADPIKLYSYAAFQAGLQQPGKLGGHHSLKEFIEKRRAYLLGLARLASPAAGISGRMQSPTSPSHTEQVWVTANVGGTMAMQEVALRYRERGVFVHLPMFDDGQHRDGKAGDRVFGVAIPSQRAGARIDYYLRAETKAGMFSYDPVSSSYEPHVYRYRVAPTRSSVLLHEILAKNTSGIVDERGEREDWIEIYNPTAAPVVLDGLFLTDDVLEPGKWRFPNNTTIGPGKATIVWADNEPEGPLHASFKLSSAGEEVILFARDGRTMLDRVQFGPLAADVSLGRIRDLVSPWVLYATPTPGSLNTIQTCGVRSYNAPATGFNGLGLQASVVPKVGGFLDLNLSGASPNAPFVLALSPTLAVTPIAAWDLLVFVDLQNMVLVAVPGTPTGSATFKVAIPNNTRLTGVQIYFQAVANGPSRLTASNGLEAKICSK